MTSGPGAAAARSSVPAGLTGIAKVMASGKSSGQASGSTSWSWTRAAPIRGGERRRLLGARTHHHRDRDGGARSGDDLGRAHGIDASWRTLPRSRSPASRPPLRAPRARRRAA